MDIAPIRARRDYRRALKQIENLMTAKRGTPKGDCLDVLVTLIEAWERQHYPLGFPDPIEAIKYHMDQKGLQPRDLIPFIGSRNRVHEVTQPPAIADPQYDSAITRRAWHSGGVSNQRWSKTGSLMRTAEKSIRRLLGAAGVEFIDENGGGPGVRLRKHHEKKS
jgi:HTH-type transcriptional regulator/antitoxin HigA